MFKPLLESLQAKKSNYWLIAVLILLPMLWLNVRHSHQWGDDFAIYISQARNIAEGKTFDSTTYQFIPGFSSLVPSAPVGFSLLLVPVYIFFGFNIYVFTLFLAIMFIAWALVSYAFWRSYFSVGTSLLMLVGGFYSNFLLWLKFLITSDIPFALLLIIISYLLLNKLKKPLIVYVIIGLLIGFAIHTRSIGIVLLPALVCHFLYLHLFVKDSTQKKQLFSFQSAAVITLVSLTVFAVLSFVFRPQSSYVDNAFSLVSLHSVMHSIAAHSIKYSHEYILLFVTTSDRLKDASEFFAYGMFVFTVVGLAVKLRNKIDYFDWVVLFYLVLIIAYPGGSDYRYIAPIHPFLIFYAFYFLQKIAGKVKVPLAVGRLLLLGCFAIIYFDHIKYLSNTTNEIVSGPYEEICQETFTYLKSNIGDNDIIVFNKPRALALYTGKKTVGYNSDASGQVNFNTLHSFGARYYLYSSMLNEEDYNAILSQNENKMIKVYKNWQFTLLKDTSELR